LEGNNNVIKDETELKEHITSYQNLFGPPEENNFTMLESRIEDIPQVLDFENDILTAEFAEAKVKASIFQMEHNKAPGPNGFPAKFY
jgi:NifB/MoaA-like Fe-S oxidoreductase